MMLARFSVVVIVRGHIRTFYEYRDFVARAGQVQVQKLEVAAFFGLPGALAMLLWRLDVKLPPGSLGALITGLAVFGALLFNLLILVYDVSGRPMPISLKPEVQRARARTLVDLHANIAFAVLLTLLTIVDLVLPVIGDNDRLAIITSAVFYYLGTLFVATLLMILRRMYLLLASDIAVT